MALSYFEGAGLKETYFACYHSQVTGVSAPLHLLIAFEKNNTFARKNLRVRCLMSHFAQRADYRWYAPCSHNVGSKRFSILKVGTPKMQKGNSL